MRKAEIFLHNEMAGWLTQDENGYHFQYSPTYLQSKQLQPVSLTLPVREQAYTSSVLFSFFDGLIPEGWLLDIAEKNWKLNPRDRMGLLLACCKDCIGAVAVQPLQTKEE
ncbi:MAG: serine/threonine-protein kinase HipA [Spirosomataceae bacterium]|jgi:serine/threonine-protein kinase HipA